MIENHAEEPGEDPNNYLYYDEENPYNADILDRPDLFYGHPDDIMVASGDSAEYPYMGWEGAMERGYGPEYGMVEDPYDRPVTAYGRPDAGMMYGDPGLVYGDDDDDDIGIDYPPGDYPPHSMDMYARPVSRRGPHGYDGHY